MKADPSICYIDGALIQLGRETPFLFKGHEAIAHQGFIRGQLKAAPHLRILQKRLAKEVTVMVHSEEDYNAAVDASNILFGNATSDALRKLDEDTLLAVFEGVPQFEISRDALAEGVKAVDLLVDNAAVFASKGEMRKLVQGGGVSLNKEKLTAFDQVITTADLLDEKYLLVQRGKKNYYLLIAK